MDENAVAELEEQINNQKGRIAMMAVAYRKDRCNRDGRMLGDPRRHVCEIMRTMSRHFPGLVEKAERIASSHQAAHAGIDDGMDTYEVLMVALRLGLEDMERRHCAAALKTGRHQEVRA